MRQTQTPISDNGGNLGFYRHCDILFGLISKQNSHIEKLCKLICSVAQMNQLFELEQVVSTHV